MKRIILLFSFFAMIVIVGCETEPILFKGPYHVRFTDSGVTKKESYSQAIKIEVHLASPAMKEDVSINYSIGGNARNGVDYTISGTGNSVVIKKGQYTGFIEVFLINNANNILRSQNLTFTLQSVSSADLEVGQGASAIGKTFTLTIEDDCILSGSYSGTKEVFDVPTEGITVSSTDCENYLLSNWNIGIFSPPYEYSLTFVDNGDNTLMIPEQDVGTKITGTGVVDPITRKITMTLVFLDFDGEELSITLTPN